MSLVRCENGHFYDNTKFKHCPHCGQNTKGRSDWTIPLFGKKAGKQQTISNEEKGREGAENEDANLTLPEQIAKAYMEEGKPSVSVKTFYAEESSEKLNDEFLGQNSKIMPDIEKGIDTASTSGKYIFCETGECERIILYK